MQSAARSRQLLRFALCTAAALAAVLIAVVLHAPGSGQRLALAPRAKFAALHAHVQSLLEDSFFIHWGAVTIGKSGQESGNRGREWNVGQNFGGFSRGRSPTEHDGGVGMFGEWGVADSDDDLSAGNSTNTTQGGEDTGSPSAAEASVATEAYNILAGSAAAEGAPAGDDNSE